MYLIWADLKITAFALCIVFHCHRKQWCQCRAGAGSKCLGLRTSNYPIFLGWPPIIRVAVATPATPDPPALQCTLDIVESLVWKNAELAVFSLKGL